MQNACFVQIKAFGDLVIANAAAGRVAAHDRARLKLAIGRHLRPLCDAISPVVEVIELDTAETGVPSIFDVQRNGTFAAVRSAWQVRGAIKRAQISSESIILFDRIGVRERFLIGAHPAKSMPQQTLNIYEGYDQLLVNASFDVASKQADHVTARRRAGIFPGSRIAAKNLPVPLIADVLDEAKRRNVPTTLFLLDGERPDLESSGLPYIRIPLNFPALRAAIEGVDAVISADSLPAHLAESAGVDVFVMTPKPNEFWMPLSVFKRRRWCLFGDSDRSARAGDFLAP